MTEMTPKTLDLAIDDLYELSGPCINVGVYINRLRPYVAAWEAMAKDYLAKLMYQSIEYNKLRERLEEALDAIRQGERVLRMPWLNTMEESQKALDLFDAALTAKGEEAMSKMTPETLKMLTMRGAFPDVIAEFDAHACAWEADLMDAGRVRQERDDAILAHHLAVTCPGALERFHRAHDIVEAGTIDFDLQHAAVAELTAAHRALHPATPAAEDAPGDIPHG